MANIGYIQVTRECNQSCLICSNPSNLNTLSFKDAKSLVDSLKDNNHVGVILTGGEPTLYEDLPKLIKYCIKKKMFPRIITNGQRIADRVYLKTLLDAGLKQLNLSVYSYRDNVQAKTSGNKNSLKNIKQALEHLKKDATKMSININIAISKYNADHLSKTVTWLTKDYDFLRHFVFNNLDPLMNRASENPDVVPRLNDFELELHQALKILQKHKKTFRVERVPLCYLTDFEHVTTETRKIVKNEDRTVYYLDKRGERTQKSWRNKKSACCRHCFLDKICAGLHTSGTYYDEKELYPVFVDPQKIINKILSTEK
ncbi:MAG: radical SAM protein [Candidatus Omnitrophica bacterium]|nr:radical SAM protein [Candidatus Omnitrophota bacterium]